MYTYNVDDSLLMELSIEARLTVVEKKLTTALSRIAHLEAERTSTALHVSSPPEKEPAIDSHSANYPLPITPPINQELTAPPSSSSIPRNHHSLWTATTLHNSHRTQLNNCQAPTQFNKHQKAPGSNSHIPNYIEHLNQSHLLMTVISMMMTRMQILPLYRLLSCHQNMCIKQQHTEISHHFRMWRIHFQLDYSQQNCHNV